MHSKKKRNAFTLLELFVILSIVLLLISIVLPAVQQIRQAAWATQCKSNLQQLGRAIHLYHSDHQMVPPWLTHLRRDQFINKSLSSYLSVQGRLLPYLECHDLYDEINTSGPPVPPYGLITSEFGNFQTVLATKVGVFVCPSDGAARHRPGAVSYRGNWGTGPNANRHYEFFDSGNGIFSILNVNQVIGVHFGTITDGLSYTSMFAERTVGGGESTASHDPTRDMRHAVSVHFISADQTLLACAALDQVNSGTFRRAGETWLISSIAHTLYNHVLPPNSAISDCVHLGTGYGAGGAPTARSFHPGAVNVCFGDASVRPINDRIALEVWRALGSRDGGEVVITGSF